MILVACGLFVSANGTPFAGEKSGNVEQVLYLISLLRLRFRSALIPATTALLLECNDPDLTEHVFRLANEIKHRFYGNRIVSLWCSN